MPPTWNVAIKSNQVYFIGVDVGTASVRAGLYSLQDRSMTMTANQPISVNRGTLKSDATTNCKQAGVTQSSAEIWDAVCTVVKQIIANVDQNSIKGIGFDATCSLVLVGDGTEAFDVADHAENKDNKGHENQDIFMWMSHHAKTETDYINEKLAGNRALDFVGGKVSLEMEIPKILWLKNNQPQTYSRVSQFMDLADFLTWKASGDNVRSMCTTVCKWLYQVDLENAESHGWDEKLLSTIGLDDLSTKRIGAKVQSPGTAAGTGLTTQAAEDLGLAEGTPVAVGLIDAHAGGLALAFCRNSDKPPEPFTKLALICGTSTCFMICSEKPTFVPGVWGPYYSAMIPESWLNEAGQSASGQFLDHIIKTHPHYISSLKNTENGDLSACYKYLNKKAEEASAKHDDIGYLSDGLHIFPDFHGNRSPVSNPEFTGMITGLTLDGESEASLLRSYVAALQALCYESRWIIKTLVDKGVDVQDVALCGGLAKNPLFVQTLADLIQRTVVLPDIEESVLLGSAILAATASGQFDSLTAAAAEMAGGGRTISSNAQTKVYHDKRYDVFMKMAEFQSNVLLNK